MAGFGIGLLPAPAPGASPATSPAVALFSLGWRGPPSVTSGRGSVFLGMRALYRTQFSVS